MSNTPHTLPSFISGTTISDLESELQAICPGKASTSGTNWVLASSQAVPQTPLPFRMRVQATGP